MGQPVQRDPTDPLWLPPKPRRPRSLLIAGSLLAVALVAGVVFSLFGGPSALVRVDGGPGGTVVTIGTTEAAADFWPVLRRLAAAEGITIRIVSFSDYAAPNPALAQKQVDLNLFQHLVFLAGYNV
ncbi:MAG: methionine ABC transporter substrate-binding protein, partial [Mycolicibacterium sp.]|nr:methionine ABC transporter substrate-binding protein [Mycolicibacterium sp.]